MVTRVEPADRPLSASELVLVPRCAVGCGTGTAAVMDVRTRRPVRLAAPRRSLDLDCIMSYNRGMSTARTRDAVPGFAPALRAARERRGLTQQQVDAAAGLAVGTTAQIEGGHRAPSLRLALLLTGAVGMSLDAFRREFTKS